MITMTAATETTIRIMKAIVTTVTEKSYDLYGAKVDQRSFGGYKEYNGGFVHPTHQDYDY